MSDAASRSATEAPGIYAGDRFECWTVIGPSASGHPKYHRCRCQCGTEKDVPARVLRNGQSRSCGCLRFALRLPPKRTGSANGLTAEQRKEIHLRWTRGESIDMLAKAFDVRRGAVTAIVRGRV